MSHAFLLDEHLPKWWQRDIVQLQPTLRVWRLTDPGAPPTGSPDPAIIVWCEVNDAYLVTNNRSTMPGHLADHVAQGRHMPGVFLVKRKFDIARLAEQLALIAGASLVDEYRDQITHLPVF